MSVYQDNNDSTHKNDKVYFSNVFSKVGKSEKSKQYQNLQNSIYSLSRDVRLLEDYVNKDKYGKIKKFEPKKVYKNLVARSNFLLRKKINTRNSNLINIIGKYINTQNNEGNHSSKKKSKNIIKQIKKYNKSMDQYDRYKTEVNKSRNIDRNLLPKINFNLDKLSETNIDSNTCNVNMTSASSRLPNKQFKTSKNIYLFTETGIINSSMNKNTFRDQLFHPEKKIDRDHNYFIKKFPKIIERNQRLKSSFNRYELNRSTDKIVKMMKEKNQKINKRINYKLAVHNLVDWEMKSKMKLASWKFGIAEIEKYFVDLNAYGKPEEEELIKRKTFYDIVEDLIDDIKQTKDKKTLDNITRNYNKENKNSKDLDKKDKNKEKNNDINMVDNVINKHSEVSRSLEKIKIRHFNEERTRRKINNILIQSDLSRKAIERSTDKLLENKNKEEMVNVTEEGTNNKIKKKNRKKHHENEGKILIKKENEEEEDHDD